MICLINILVSYGRPHTLDVPIPSEFGYGRPVWIYDMTGAKIGYDQKRARELKEQYA